MIDLLDLAGRDRGRLDLPGVSARRSGSMLELRIRSLEMSVGPFEYGLPLPGRVDVPEAGVTIEAAEGRPDALPGRVSSCDVLVSKSCMELPLRVRSRRAGDRFRPLGASGSRKLQDVLVDRKVPRHRRDRVPIVVDAKDRILWVVGVTLAEACRVPAAQSGVVTLKSSPLAGER
jgi:tRNA(Ile)-lysidine synthase